MTNGVNESGLDGVSPHREKEVLITFDLPLSEKLPLEESLALISKQGYQRILVGEEIVRLDEVVARARHSSFDRGSGSREIGDCESRALRGGLRAGVSLWQRKAGDSGNFKLETRNQKSETFFKSVALRAVRHRIS
jgi:hypothetical protein